MNHHSYSANFVARFLIAVLLSALAGCAAVNLPPEELQPRAIVSGDRVKIIHSCRNARTGQILSSLDKQDLANPDITGSGVFFYPKQTDPWVVIAGNDPGGPPFGKLHPFEHELIAQISPHLVGLHMGEEIEVALTAEIPEGLDEQERFLKLKRNQFKPRTVKIKAADFVEKYQRPAQAGEVLYSDGNITGTVHSVGEDLILVDISAEPGTIIKTTFGPGRIESVEGGYLVSITPNLNQLVKSAFLLGKISQVTDRQFTIDYGHPFGGEVLLCDVAVVGRQLLDAEESLPSGVRNAQ